MDKYDLPQLFKIQDEAARNAVLSARLVFSNQLDDEKLSDLLIKFEQILEKVPAQFEIESDLGKTIRIKDYLEENGLPLIEALALLTLHEAKLENFGAAIEAYLQIPIQVNQAQINEMKPHAIIGEKVSKKMSKARAIRTSFESKKIQKRQAEWLELNTKYLLRNPKASISQVANHIYLKVIDTDAERSVRTIRAFLSKKRIL
jgi:hypothetical protein